jgi:hypothetical protein
LLKVINIKSGCQKRLIGKMEFRSQSLCFAQAFMSGFKKRSHIRRGGPQWQQLNIVANIE